MRRANGCSAVLGGEGSGDQAAGEQRSLASGEPMPGVGMFVINLLTFRARGVEEKSKPAQVRFLRQ